MQLKIHWYSSDKVKSEMGERIYDSFGQCTDEACYCYVIVLCITSLVLSGIFLFYFHKMIL